MEKKSVYDVLRELDNVDFIEKLRETAEEKAMPLCMVRVLLDEAAKRIEDMDERIAIMGEPEEDDGVNDRCYECSGLGDDYYMDENGEFVSACDDCPDNPANREE